MLLPYGWINILFLPFPVQSFFRASLVFLAGCCCRTTIDGTLQPMHLDSHAPSEEPGIQLFIYPQPSFEDSPPRYKFWQSASRPQSSFSCHGACDQQQEVSSVSLMSLELLELWKYEEHDPGIFFFFPGNEQRGTCQSVFLKANSGRDATVCSCHWAKGINMAQTWGTV